MSRQVYNIGNAQRDYIIYRVLLLKSINSMFLSIDYIIFRLLLTRLSLPFADQTKDSTVLNNSNILITFSFSIKNFDVLTFLDFNFSLRWPGNGCIRHSNTCFCINGILFSLLRGIGVFIILYSMYRTMECFALYLTQVNLYFVD